MGDKRSAKLRYHINMQGLLIGDVAEKLNVRRETMTSKLKDPGRFTVKQMNVLAETLHLNEQEILECFFDTKVSSRLVSNESA